MTTHHTQKPRRTLCASALLALAILAWVAPLTAPAAPLGTAFTYQGRLNDGGNPANGRYELRFFLYDLGVGGGLVGVPLTLNNTAVSNGLFTVTLDFGDQSVYSPQYTPANRWLEIAVRTNGGGAFTSLTPRQKITPTPFAIEIGRASCRERV